LQRAPFLRNIETTLILDEEVSGIICRLVRRKQQDARAVSSTCASRRSVETN
jgi:hypothetical protein